MNNYFVTGIGTNVGKTIAAAILTEALQADYWKPVQCGTEGGTDTEKVKKLISNPVSVIHPETFLLKEPASPHIASAKENRSILKSNFQLPAADKQLVIEGAGGILVPLNEKEFVIDLAKKWDASVLLVVGSYLGCINHTLLSIDYLLTHRYNLKGLILNGNFEEGVMSAIVSYKNIPVLGKIPYVKNPDQQFVTEQALKIDCKLFV